MWGGLVDYSHYTGDPSYDDTIANAIVAEASPTVDFMLPSQHFDLGNDDQVFWALTAMSAAEYNFKVPAGTAPDIYYQLCKNTFNDMVGRWNTTQCNGGLKWQIYPENNGFDYKSSIANGGFFQLAARLARYTGNITYVEWADKVYTWMTDIGYINSISFAVFDGAGDEANCTQIDPSQWSYNAATLIHGSAVMWNVSRSEKWKTRTVGHVQAAAQTFFSPYSNATSIMYEHNCEATKCDTDQLSFKAYLSRWMAKSTLMLADISSAVGPLLTASANAAAEACAGGPDSRQCGTKWYVGGWDGTLGVGQQMSALETIQSLLVGTVSVAGTM